MYTVCYRSGYVRMVCIVCTHTVFATCTYVCVCIYILGMGDIDIMVYVSRLSQLIYL